MMLILALLVSARAETRLTLEQAITLVVEQNPDVRSARLGELIAAIGETRAELDRFTAVVGVDGNLGLGVTQPWNGDAYNSTDGSWTAAATVGVPLYAGGRIDATIDRARAEAELAKIQVALTERDLVRGAYTAYWNVRGLELRIAAAEEGLEATREALAIIQSKADNGLAAGFDVNRSTVDLLSQQESLVAQQAALVRARQQLVQLLASADPDLVLVTDPPHAAAEGGVALPAEPLASRPELDRQQLSVTRAEADRRVVRSAALPTLSLSGSAGFGATATGGGPDLVLPTFDTTIPSADFDADTLSRPALSASVGLVLSWTPFDLLRTRQGVEQAGLAIDQVQAANESERNRLLAEVRSTAAEVESMRARYPLVDQQLALARDNQDIVRDLYAQGSATILDLFNAQAAFRAAAIQEAALAVNLATAELDLRWLLGEDLLSGVSR